MQACSQSQSLAHLQSIANNMDPIKLEGESGEDSQEESLS